MAARRRAATRSRFAATSSCLAACLHGRGRIGSGEGQSGSARLLILSGTAGGTLESVRYEVHRAATPGGEAQIVVHEHRGAGEMEDILAEALTGLDASTAAQLWIRQVAPGDDAAARLFGFEPYRDLWQLRCELPSEPSGLATRAFRLDDLDEFVSVNNRAFHWHPEQGGLTAADVRDRMGGSWFDADGFRLHHREGRLAGFCWTKVHAGHDPPLGEIYVIAVDPDFAGRGLGRPMTLAGLEWLSSRGLAAGMLYVESDNHPANAVYRRIGFKHHHTDRAYRRVSPSECE